MHTRSSSLYKPMSLSFPYSPAGLRFPAQPLFSTTSSLAANGVRMRYFESALRRNASARPGGTTAGHADIGQNKTDVLAAQNCGDPERLPTTKGASLETALDDCNPSRWEKDHWNKRELTLAQLWLLRSDGSQSSRTSAATSPKQTALRRAAVRFKVARFSLEGNTFKVTPSGLAIVLPS